MTTLVNIEHLPDSPGVYLFKDSGGTILYVGKAKNLHKRVSQYFAPGSLWKQDMLTKATNIDFIEVRTESEALYLEDNLIKTHNPPYNRLLKGDNSYIYLKITNEDFPQLYLTRMRKADGAKYIGPKHNTKELRQMMHYLRQIYQYRTMKSKEFSKGKLSSDVYFGLDKGRSIIAKYKDNITERTKAIAHTGLLLDKSYQEYQAQYADIVSAIIAFFQGNTSKVTKRILADMEDAIAKQHFERCARLKTLLSHIDQRTERQHVVFAPEYDGVIAVITELQAYRIVIIMRIMEGKIIDIVRKHRRQDEFSQTQIISAIEMEYQQSLSLFEKISSDGLVWYTTPKLKKLKQSDRSGCKELVEKVIHSYVVSIDVHQDNLLLNDMLKTLQDRYHLRSLPYQMECLDISHLSGSNISAGLAAMTGGILDKRYYRHYKIKTIDDSKGNYSNDLLSLQEVMVRRLALKGTSVVDYPDLLILDGGLLQLQAFQELYQIFPHLKSWQGTMSVIALGKGQARKESSKMAGNTETVYRIDEQGKIQSRPLIYDQADKLLTKIRDEAHRFANAYRVRRTNQQRKS